MDKLTEIMAHKRREILPLLRPVFLEELVELNKALPAPPSFLKALKRPDGQLAVIAEIKRRSPSAGAIREHASALEQAHLYRAAGASALSILTDEKYFGGTLADLAVVTKDFAKNPVITGEKSGKPGPSLSNAPGLSLSNAPGLSLSNALPCLRKDFMVHPIQVQQARLAGASAILIIVRALTDGEIESLHQAATAAGLDVLFEIHNSAELQRAVAHQAKIIGVNNRDLAIFKTDLALSEQLIPKFPKGIVAVSESGISTPADADRVRRAGAHAVLVGEALMRADDPGRLIRDFRRHV
ncbi:MAG: indole-3-glycerol phosphate synthase TrpC [Opitutae bacterium]